MKHKFIRGARLIIAACAALFVLLFSYRALVLSHPSLRPLSQTEQTALTDALIAYNDEILRPLPYNIDPQSFPLNSGSAIVFDAANGCVLFEKNVDEIIPPASMTKLVVMFVVFEKIAAGEISFNDVVPLPPESWAMNALPGSSLMYLAQGQKVTLKELMLGMAVPSGNDAAAAVACYISGSVAQFCVLMNQTMRELGLFRTSFADASGYSELNVTTPREFAAFLNIYLSKYGYGADEATFLGARHFNLASNGAADDFAGALAEFHSVKTFTYPQAWNVPDVPENRLIQHTFSSTNPALGAIPGCDGIKTGFIPESGYNFSFTVQRNGTRFIAVMMNGPGTGSREGNRYRLSDAQTLTEHVFDSFATRAFVSVPRIVCPVTGGKEIAVQLVPAHTRALTVPAILEGKTAREAAESVEVEFVLPRFVSAPIQRGQEAGKIVYKLDGFVLEEIPLTADRTIEQSGIFMRAIDSAAKIFLR